MWRVDSMRFITGNKNKLAEVQTIIPSVISQKIEVDEVQSLDPYEVILKKTRLIVKQCSEPFFCEDVSLEMHAINNFPGPLIKFALKALGCDGLYNLVKDRDTQSATARCMIGYYDGDQIHVVEGCVNGTIVPAQGSKFGFDPIFMPDGEKETYAQMDIKKKNKISHRAKALERLREIF